MLQVEWLLVRLHGIKNVILGALCEKLKGLTLFSSLTIQTLILISISIHNELTFQDSYFRPELVIYFYAKL